MMASLKFTRPRKSRCSNGLLAFGVLVLVLGLGDEALGQILPPNPPSASQPASMAGGIAPKAAADVPIARIATNSTDRKGLETVASVVAREAVLEARIKELEAAAIERTAREVQLEQRLKAIEAMVSARSASVSSLGAQVPGRAGAIDPPAGEEALVVPGVNSGTATPPANPLAVEPQANAPIDAVPGFDVVEEPQGVPGGGGAAAPAPNLAASATSAAKKPDMPFTPKLNKGYAGAGPGFVISTDDDEYQLQFHSLTQFELRQYNDQNMSPTKSSFGFPRQWLIFNGRLTKPIEYLVTTNWGFTNLNLLDAFINLHYDDRVQVKLGRFKTPWSYEFYAEPVNGLISPERSIYFNNYGPNRDLGAMVWGQIFGKTTDYAVGVFNGVRNGNVDTNNAKDVMAYLNARPFEKTDADFLKFWNIGGSVSSNVYNGLARPEVFRTNVPYPGDATMSPLWLQLNGNTQNFGSAKLWSLHSAYYYKQLSLIGEFFGGYETYAKISNLMHGTKVPNNGWYIQSGYFLTGEQVTSRGMVSPLRPFNPKGWSGLGAFELAFRYADMNVDKSIFKFANNHRWTNNTSTLDLGVNWYWSNNVKFYVGWQRALFGDPIQAAPGVNSAAPPSYWMSSSDMLWLRAQLYY